MDITIDVGALRNVEILYGNSSLNWYALHFTEIDDSVISINYLFPNDLIRIRDAINEWIEKTRWMKNGR